MNVDASGEGERGEGQAGSYLLSTTTQTKAALAIVASSALRAWVVDFGRGWYWALKFRSRSPVASHHRRYPAEIRQVTAPHAASVE